MKKRPSHRLWEHFSNKCCAKNTQTVAALKSIRTALMRPNIVVIYQMFIGKSLALEGLFLASTT